MKKLRYSIYIYLFFGSLCQFDFAHGREPVERLGSWTGTKNKLNL